ncbi:hypothetical protein D1B31_05740 [Neobacillus notoginsengisoli]|uniref:Uncharacterized protein n=1 Tax=Neobacillus notoginsengisoli TaxID=1578198 RepID=A0A417YXL8_9BACI|nr:hypothetical protein D1B31_05740 [Neobacillus notoginsengisoli]
MIKKPLTFQKRRGFSSIVTTVITK